MEIRTTLVVILMLDHIEDVESEQLKFLKTSVKVPDKVGTPRFKQGHWPIELVKSTSYIVINIPNATRKQPRIRGAVQLCSGVVLARRC
mgnify:CR=1 FL=1